MRSPESSKANPAPSANPHQAWIGIGSNLDDPVAHARRALEDLAGLSGTVIERRSRLYRTTPLPSAERQPDYINAVALLSTRMDARELLNCLLSIEAAHGRTRVAGADRNQARALDLDILLFDDERLVESGLVVPHPRMRGRGFVLFPLLEIDPGLRLPNGDRILDLARSLPSAGIAGSYADDGGFEAFDASDFIAGGDGDAPSPH